MKACNAPLWYGVGEVGAFDHMTDEQLMQEAMERARQLGLAGPAEVIQLTPKSG
jgi:hypothetical protein